MEPGEVRARRRYGAVSVRETGSAARAALPDRPGAVAVGQRSAALADWRPRASAARGRGLADRAARSSADAAYDAAGSAAAAVVAGAASSPRRARPRRVTPISIRSGVGAENDRRSVLRPSPFT